MEEREWVQRPDKPMAFSVVRSSGARWHGMSAFVYDATDGYSDLLMTDHSISMHLSRPTLVTTRCDGTSLHRLQRAGDVKIVPAGYSRVWQTSAPTRKVVVDLTPELLEGVAREFRVETNGAAVTPQLHVSDERIKHVMFAIAAELQSEDEGNRIYAESLGRALAAGVLQRYAAARHRRIAGGLPKRRLDRVIDYIADNLDRNPSLAEIASVADVSASHFKVLFKQSTGLAVHQYVVRARVERAVGLIARTSMPLSAVAFQCGFSNQSHLARCVRAVRGVRPSELRREAR